MNDARALSFAHALFARKCRPREAALEPRRNPRTKPRLENLIQNVQNAQKQEERRSDELLEKAESARYS